MYDRVNCSSSSTAEQVTPLPHRAYNRVDLPPHLPHLAELITTCDRVMLETGSLTTGNTHPLGRLGSESHEGRKRGSDEVHSQNLESRTFVSVVAGLSG